MNNASVEWKNPFIPERSDKPLRDPTPQELENSLVFDAIWQAIKRWDLQRQHGDGYAGATGTDVCTILDAIRPYLIDDFVV